MKKAVFWDVVPCRNCVAPDLTGSFADFLSSTLMMEAIRSSETSVNTISTRRHIPEDGFFNIRVDLRRMGWDGMNWIDLTQDRDQWRALANRVMKLRLS
jgi:hypothetical protein